MPIVLVLPGFSSMVPVARMAVRNLLSDCPRVDDVELIISELATNAVRHSTSRGAQFEVRLDVKPAHLRIEVQDGGPFGYPPPAPPKSPAFPTEPWTTLYEEDRHRDRAAEAEEYARGLTVIDACCDDWGHNRYPDHAIWWAELTWVDPTAPIAATPSPEPKSQPDPEPTSAPNADAGTDTDA
jgi:anti-sigma regulatory factor (Ser/Thr protein kinase)